MPPTKAGVRELLEGATVTKIALAALIAAALLGAATVRKADQVTNAVQRPEFHDTVRAIRADVQSGVQSALTRAEVAAQEAAEASNRATSIGCFIAKYPAGLCDNVPRAAQAGAPR